jgi:hypothetical protein
VVTTALFQEQALSSAFGNQSEADLILGGFLVASSDAECALVGEKGRRATRVQEDDILVFAPTPLADQGDQARKSLARIDRIKRKSLEPACKPDRFDCGFMRDPVGRSRMPRNDLHRRFVERNIKQIGRFARKRHNIGSHPHGLGIDINPDDPCVWQCYGCTDDEAGLRARASRAVHDGGRCKTRLRRLRFDLANRRGIGDCAQRIRDPVWHKMRPVPLRFEITNERANGCIAVTGPGHVMQVRAAGD